MLCDTAFGIFFWVENEIKVVFGTDFVKDELLI